MKKNVKKAMVSLVLLPVSVFAFTSEEIQNLIYVDFFKLITTQVSALPSDTPSFNNFSVISSDYVIKVGEGGDFANLNDALQAVSKWIIADNAKVIFSISSGKYILNDRIHINHPYSHRMTIKGAGVTTLKFSSFGGITKISDKEYDVKIGLASTTGVLNGGYIRIKDTSGYGNGIYQGIWKIVKVENNSVTFRLKTNSTKVSVSTMSGGIIDYFKTELHFPNSMGIYVQSRFGGGSGVETSINNLLITGNPSLVHTGVHVEYGGKFVSGPNFAIADFGKFGIYTLYNSISSVGNITISNVGSHCLYSLNQSSIQAVNSILSGCNGYSAAAAFNSTLAITNSTLSGSNGGIFILNNSSVAARNSLIQGNKNNGLDAKSNSSALLDKSIISLNGGYAVTAEESSTFSASTTKFSGNTLGNIKK